MVKSRELVTTNGRAVFYAAMWDDLRQAAMDCGWALGLHGSLASDMDIMAMPWTESAKEPLEMIMALKKCFDKPGEIVLNETPMPNNRMVYTLSIWGDFYLDINAIRHPSRFLKEDVYRIVAEFIRTYDTGKFISGDEPIEKVIQELKEDRMLEDII